jgi:LPLT family lysophospholipid transporter-like MFS transporter
MINASLLCLLAAQFISAFADNSILFTVIALIMQQGDQVPTWYVPALQSSFLVAFVIFAPLAGMLADHYSKARILILANIIKAAGAALLLVSVEPMIAYGIVGLGAALYSPAKYGILPELVDHQTLMKANSWIEASTIVAILLGMIIGAKLADASIQGALWTAIGLFLLSALIAIQLPKTNSIEVLQHNLKNHRYAVEQLSNFIKIKLVCYTLMGGCLFWATAATLRVILVAWAPLILSLHNASDIVQLTLFLAIGIIIGSALVPRLISIEQLGKTKFAIYIMAILIIGLSLTSSLWIARLYLFFIGIMGGIFIVPINATLQEKGQQSIGSGKATALQGFFQNLAMLIAVGSYSYAMTFEITPTDAMLFLGLLLLASGVTMSLLLKKHS